MLVIKGIKYSCDIEALETIFGDEISVWDEGSVDETVTVKINAKAIVEYGDGSVEVYNSYSRSEWVSLRIPEDCDYIGRSDDICL